MISPELREAFADEFFVRDSHGCNVLPIPQQFEEILSFIAEREALAEKRGKNNLAVKVLNMLDKDKLIETEREYIKNKVLALLNQNNKDEK